jgi:hypothetical protein
VGGREAEHLRDVAVVGGGVVVGGGADHGHVQVRGHGARRDLGDADRRLVLDRAQRLADRHHLLCLAIEERRRRVLCFLAGSEETRRHGPTRFHFSSRVVTRSGRRASERDKRVDRRYREITHCPVPSPSIGFLVPPSNHGCDAYWGLLHAVWTRRYDLRPQSIS